MLGNGIFRLVVASVALLLTLTPAAFAARLLHYTITVDGKTYKTGIYTDDGLADAPAVWAHLHKVQFSTEGGPKEPPEPGPDPLRARIKGDVRVRVEHAGRVIAEAKLSELLLTRTDAKKDEWTLPVEEVERTAKAAGLSLPADDGKLKWDIMWWVVIALLLGLIIFRLLDRRAKAAPADSKPPS